MNVVISESQVQNLKKLINEIIVSEDVSASDVSLSSFKLKKELNQKFWKNDKKLNARVRNRLLKIADDFIKFINIDDKFCEDILFLGSLTNYNWSEYSDIDLHILVDFKKINKDFDFVKDYFDAKRRIWNDEHGNLKIYGFQVELYVQDINEENNSLSVYSLEKNKWLKKSNLEDVELLNKDKIKQKSADFMNQIDDLIDNFKKNEIEKTSTKVKAIYDKIKKLRKSGLKSKDGEFSVGNIVFKVLRRSGYIEKLVDLKRDSYDKLNSIK